jgi:monovalent cation:H+ antiporter-2, CPA2 family
VEAHGVERADVDAAHRAIVIGYGPTGRTVTRLLQDNGIAPTVVELNIDTVRQLKERGLPTVYGDAAKRDTLTGAGVETAGHLILTSPGDSAEIIRTARELNPSINVLARATALRDIAGFRAAGADEVFSGEGEVALALATAILERLGATAEQIDRERERSHRSLFGSAAADERPALTSPAARTTS